MLIPVGLISGAVSGTTAALIASAKFIASHLGLVKKVEELASHDAGTRLDLLEATTADLKEANLNVRVSTLEQTMAEIKVSISKLSVLDTLAARADILITEIRDMKNMVVPRSELEARLDAANQRFDRIEKRIDDLRK